MAKKLQRSFNCPTEFALEVLGGKWKTVILCNLKQRPCRYAELRKLVPKLSDKMLTERLRDLTERGLIAKTKGTANTRGDVYALTQRGRSLSGPLKELYEWGRRNAALYGVEVGEPFANLKSPPGRPPP
jgi:DNA-binding HxlR family transcriptional regulator